MSRSFLGWRNDRIAQSHHSKWTNEKTIFKALHSINFQPLLLGKPFLWRLLHGYFCLSYLRFIFHGILKTILMIFCRWQQQLFSLKVGASGALFGLIGLLIVKMLQLRHDVKRPCCEVLFLLVVVLISFGKYNKNLRKKNTQSLWIIPSSEESLLKSILLCTEFLALSVDHNFSLALSLSTV